MIDNIMFLNRIYTPAIPKEPKKLSQQIEIIDVIQQVDKNKAQP